MSAVALKSTLAVRKVGCITMVQAITAIAIAHRFHVFEMNDIANGVGLGPCGLLKEPGKTMCTYAIDAAKATAEAMPPGGFNTAVLMGMCLAG
jgi:hypothetical protein